MITSEPHIETCTFTEKLEKILAAGRVAEKWIVAPSLRTGYQWLDMLTRQNAPLMNVHVRTLREIALSIAVPGLTKIGLKFVSNIRQECAVAAAFRKLSGGVEGYLTSLSPDTKLFSAIRRTLSDIRLASLGPKDIPAAKFEVEHKGEEISTLIRLYEEELDSCGWCDYANVLMMAMRELENKPDTVFGNVAAVVVTDSDLESFSYLENKFWHSFPGNICHVVGNDKNVSDKLSDLQCLSWLDSPQSAPRPEGDNSVRLFNSVGEVNEVQEVFRRILAESIPFDHVEIIHSSPAGYLSTIYEQSFKLLCCSEAGEVPVTFSEGIPASYFRPVRALSFWLDWLGDNYPQKNLSAAIREGLLIISPEMENYPGFQRIASVMDEYPIGFDKDRYGLVIGRALRSLELKLEDPGLSRAEKSETELKINCLRVVNQLAGGLIELSEGRGNDFAILVCAETFLEKYARSVDLLDNYAHKALLDKIRELILAYGESNYHPERSEMMLRLREAISGLRIQGQGPRPGKIFVSPLSQGGHSGRPVTYILGMDETKFPGSTAQDPLFLDNERARVSERLITSGKRTEMTENNLYYLLRGLNGKLTVSYSSRSVEDERESSAAIAFLSIYRIVSGRRDGDYSDMLAYLGPPMSFVPENPENALTVAQASASSLIEADEDRRDMIYKTIRPSLARGREAMSERFNSTLTSYDGYVPEAGINIFNAETAPLFSASALEMAARSPYDYFLRHVLHIKPVEQLEPPPGGWLRNDQRGLILHETFSTYYRTLIEKRGELTAQAFDRELAMRVLHDTIERFADRFPPAREDLVSRDIRDLEDSIDIFLAVERDPSNSWKPCYFETSIGMLPDEYPSELDSREPVEIDLGQGIRVRLRGRIDRVDIREIDGTKEALIWDYKTGSSGSYSEKTPFDKGRKLQGVVYPFLVEKRIREVLGEDAVLHGFGYYLASDRGDGERISWRLDQLGVGKEILMNIAGMLKRGVFPAGEEVPDPRWNDLYDAYGDAGKMSAKTGQLLENDEPLLLQLKRIRELGDKIELE